MLFGVSFWFDSVFENLHASLYCTAGLTVWSTLDGCGWVALGRQSQGTDTTFLLWLDATTDPWARTKAESYNTQAVGFPSRQNFIHWSREGCLERALSASTPHMQVTPRGLTGGGGEAVPVQGEKGRSGREKKGHEGHLAPKRTLPLSSKVES